MSNVIDIKSGEIKQSTVTVLKDININISSNDIVYLIGKTGSGKSSLLKTLYGELKMFAGSGGVAGFDLNKLRKKDVPNLRRSIGIVFQDFQLLTDRTVLKNLLFVMGASGWKDKALMEKRAKEVLQLVGIEDVFEAMKKKQAAGKSATTGATYQFNKTAHRKYNSQKSLFERILKSHSEGNRFIRNEDL